MHEMFNIKFDKPFFERGQYEATALNGTEEIAITNPWAASGTNSAPFDQCKYFRALASSSLNLNMLSFLPHLEPGCWGPQWLVPRHSWREDVV